jgi:hypothetical protein
VNRLTIGTDEALRLFAEAEGSQPLVTLRCSRRCGERLGEVFHTPKGPLLHAWRSTQRQVFTVDTSAIEDVSAAANLPGAPEDFEEIAVRGHVRRGGDLEPLPYAALLVGGWHPDGGRAACSRHGTVGLDLERLLTAARQAKPGGKPVRVYAFAD